MERERESVCVWLWLKEKMSAEKTKMGVCEKEVWVFKRYTTLMLKG